MPDREDQYFEVSFPEGSFPAAILPIQTAGDMLNCNPHIHGLVASGGFQPDGSFAPGSPVQESVLRELFGARVFRLLAGKGLIGPGLLSWKGDPGRQYRIYKGPNPVQMKSVESVSGVQWIDHTADSSPITCYRVEAL